MKTLAYGRGDEGRSRFWGFLGLGFRNGVGFDDLARWDGAGLLGQWWVLWLERRWDDFDVRAFNWVMEMDLWVAVDGVQGDGVGLR